MKKYSTTTINNLTFDNAYEYLKNAYTLLDNAISATIRSNVDGSYTLEVITESEDTLPDFTIFQSEDFMEECYCDLYGYCAGTSCPHYAKCEGW